ncbi:MAG TPA: GEVED domain-containing protein [Flavipsychrobacter sp.]|nr:GEVED domain-containing protein [Flavipsychrobacter sp.]
MKNMFTLKKTLLSGLVLAMVMTLSFQAKAQPFNFASSFYYSTVFDNSPGGGTGGPLPAPGYGAYIYNDDNIPPYPATAIGDYTYVATGGYIKIWWPVILAIQNNPINKFVFFFNDRPPTHMEIEHWNGTAYVTDTVWNSQVSMTGDSISLVNPITILSVNDTIRINNITGYSGNPTFREIRLYSLPTCSGTPTNNNVSVDGMTSGGYQYQVTSLNACLGTPIALHAESAFFENGHHYQWQILKANSSTWQSIPGATSMGYLTEAQCNAQYRVVDTCVASGQFAISNNTVTVTVTSPTYATIPYFQDFENWVTTCVPTPFTFNVPDASWVNTNSFGDSSWRVNIQAVNNATPFPAIVQTGYTAGWGSNNGFYSPNAKSGTYSARAHSSRVDPYSPTNLNLYLNCSGSTGTKQLYFYMINKANGAAVPPGVDSLRILMSVDSGTTWQRLDAFDTAVTWKRRSVAIPSNSPTTILRFQSMTYDNRENTDIGIDSVYIAGPCSGNPLAGRLTPGGTLSACAGTSYYLTTVGTTMAGGLVYTWEQSSYNAGTWSAFTAVNGGIGSSTQFFNTPPLYDTIRYRMKVQCGPTGTADYTDTITINVAERYYAQLPYMQGFETWTSKCSTNDVPVSTIPTDPLNWANNPASGWNTWRRDDQGTSGGWFSAANGSYSPLVGHSARFHSAGTFLGQTGNLDVLFDGSSSTGNKEVRFFQTNTNGGDSLRVYYSTDAGVNFTSLASYGANAAGWYQSILQVPCNTGTCVVRFQGYGQFGTTSDIGIDSLMILPPCSAIPTAGVISSDTPCSGATFTLQLSGYSVSGGITYIWEQAPTATGPWVPAGSTTTYLTTSITANTYYRVRVNCAASGQQDITPVRYIPLASFYWCYCTSYASVGAGADIGSVAVKKLPYGIPVFTNGSATPVNNNGGANKTYSDFRNPNSPIPVYRDSSYSFTIKQINSGSFTSPGTTISVWIDSNHNGAFDANEMIAVKNSVNTTNPQQTVIDTFNVPATMRVGLTGLRVIMQQGTNQIPAACGPFSAGETEDYLIDIRYHPCLGAPNTGLVWLSDSLACPGYAITALDTTHEHELYNLSWVWQYSPDSNAWANIAGSAGRDTVTQTVTGQTYFRLQMVCLETFDTAYSNAPKVIINPPYACYCLSMAVGGAMDTSDIGGVTLDDMTIYNSGPHLLNPTAYRSHTDYTRTDTLDLFVDSTYYISVYHTMNSAFHHDAKITLFMDLNNDFMYTRYPVEELIWTGYSSANNFVVTDSIRIPSYAMPNVLTGMRLILNNDIGPNTPSDSACGVYTSGETEDYVVRFHVPFSVGVHPLDNVTRLSIYPNPTDGKFNVWFEAKKAVEHATITVTNLTGQKILEREFNKPGRQFLKEIDLNGVARGVYLVELRADNEKQMQKLIVK